MRPETFSIVHIFGSPLSFPMPLAISHFFLTHIYRLAIFGSLSKGVFEQRASTGASLAIRAGPAHKSNLRIVQHNVLYV